MRPLLNLARSTRRGASSIEVARGQENRSATSPAATSHRDRFTKEMMPRQLVRPTAVLALLVLCTPMAWGNSGGTIEPSPGAQRVVFVGNNWEGTADVLTFDAATGNFSRIARLNIIPDLEERMQEIYLDPVRLGYFLGIRMAVGEGNDQFVDDLYSVNEGRTLVVSRPSLRDVIGLDIASGEIAWRFVVDGQRSDHMAISPDGAHVAVSASTGNVVHILDVETGAEVARFESGDSPHENVYSADGSRIFHASIGLVYTPADQPVLDTTKGERYFQVVDADTMEILSRVDMGEKLEEAGYPDMSAAVRPMALSSDERVAYLQVSFFHGIVEYDIDEERVLRVADLPNYVPDTPREQYLLDSAHHGIAMNAAGDQLCVAGTMSDYAAMVDPTDFTYRILQKPEGAKPYWSTTSDDGGHCFISWSGLDTISAIDYASGEIVGEIDVGYHPQRVRTGEVQSDWAAQQEAPA